MAAHCIYCGRDITRERCECPRSESFAERCERATSLGYLPGEDGPLDQWLDDLERTDPWGRPVVSATDGHSAWSCNDRDCLLHPRKLYGPVGCTHGADGAWNPLCSVCVDQSMRF